VVVVVDVVVVVAVEAVETGNEPFETVDKEAVAFEEELWLDPDARVESDALNPAPLETLLKLGIEFEAAGVDDSGCDWEEFLVATTELVTLVELREEVAWFPDCSDVVRDADWIGVGSDPDVNADDRSKNLVDCCWVVPDFHWLVVPCWPFKADVSLLVAIWPGCCLTVVVAKFEAPDAPPAGVSPSSLASSFPASFPSSLAFSFPASFPSSLAFSFPASFPSSFLSPFPSSIPSSFPSSLPSALSSPLLLSFPWYLVSLRPPPPVSTPVFSDERLKSLKAVVFVPVSIASELFGFIYNVSESRCG
jgi:hypothetical protein